MNHILKITIVFGLAASGAALLYAGGQPQSRHPDSEGVQQAIRFERAKDTADARQARLEAARGRQGAEPESAVPANDGAASGDGGVRAAIRFERAKDAADARQARLEANRPSEAAHSTVAARRLLTANK
jgi:hypothetical protein